MFRERDLDAWEIPSQGALMLGDAPETDDELEEASEEYGFSTEEEEPLAGVLSLRADARRRDDDDEDDDDFDDFDDEDEDDEDEDYYDDDFDEDEDDEDFDDFVIDEDDEE